MELGNRMIIKTLAKLDQLMLFSRPHLKGQRAPFVGNIGSDVLGGHESRRRKDSMDFADAGSNFYP